jgi:hypothetical protein
MTSRKRSFLRTLPIKTHPKQNKQLTNKIGIYFDLMKEGTFEKSIQEELKSSCFYEQFDGLELDLYVISISLIR